MVSELWSASAHGDSAKVAELLDSGNVDLEVKDQEGVTPLINAVKNGHVDVVKALLDKGADPSNGTNQGLPESYTSDPVIIDALRAAAASKATQPTQTIEANGYVHDLGHPPRGYYMPPPAPYYYPGMPPPQEGAVPYYPPPSVQPHPQPQHGGEQQQQQQHPHVPPGSAQGTQSNLPPPEIARLIPCRYFPACRYGASCMFAHPPGPYMAPPPMPPPGQYPTPYENGVPAPFPPNFYTIPPPPNFPSPNGIPPQHISPISPQSPPQTVPPPQAMMHQRSASDMLSPAQGAFAAGIPSPMYGPTSPISPAGYTNGVTPPVPHHMPIVSPIAVPGPQSPQIYPQGVVPPTAPAYEQQQQQQPTDMTRNQSLPSAPAQQRSFVPTPGNGPKPSPTLAGSDIPGANGHRDATAPRRGGFRRGSAFGNRKPPCAFFPTGRCRNGDDCRFPHITPDNVSAHQGPPSFMDRGGRFRSNTSHNNANQTNGIEEAFANMNSHDESHRGRGSDRSSNSTSSSQARSGPGKTLASANGSHGARPNQKSAAVLKQRVPNADEFPVLGGSTTPPSRSPGANGVNGLSGPTAAQVLQNGAPSRKDLVKDFFRGGAPLPQGVSESATQAAVLPTTSTAVTSTPLVSKLPISFAAVANGVTDASKEVSVAA